MELLIKGDNALHLSGKQACACSYRLDRLGRDIPNLVLNLLQEGDKRPLLILISRQDLVYLLQVRFGCFCCLVQEAMSFLALQRMLLARGFLIGDPARCRTVD